MIYELRTYWAVPGKIEKLHDRFLSLTLNIFKKYNMEIVGFWTPISATPESGDLVYILRFANESERNVAWESYRADQDWIKGKKISEMDGKLIIKTTSILLKSTDYSPLQ
jgi:hypothetical protein